MAEKLKIGVPRTFYYYDYFVFCKTFIETLGHEVVVSPMTDKELLHDGLKISINEFCIPIKSLFGHVSWLSSQKVDYVLIPYIKTMDKKSYLCPKLIASPDIIRSSFDVKVLSPEIDLKNLYTSIYDALKELFVTLGFNPATIYSAYRNAMKKQDQFYDYKTSGFTFQEALDLVEGNAIDVKIKHPTKVAVIGHNYIINDSFLNGDIFEKLEKYNVSFVTSDVLTQEQIDKELEVIEQYPHFAYANRVLATALHFSKDKGIAGIIYITPFGCSADSLMKELLIANMHSRKPILTISVDEHTGQAGMITRLEAFLDMVEKRMNVAQSSAVQEKKGIVKEISQILESHKSQTKKKVDLKKVNGMKKKVGKVKK